MRSPPCPLRSKLFVPGSRPELFRKALGGLADALSLDLEDAVQESRKAEARAEVRRFLESPELAASGKTVIVRVNRPGSPHFAPDLVEVVCARLDVVNLPKVESADEVRAVADILKIREAERGISRPIGILANIESPRGLARAGAIATADPRVQGLQLGLGDLFGNLGIDRSDAAAIHHIQLAVRLAAGEGGIWAYDAAYPGIDDAAGFKREAQAAQKLGYLGKSCIHPSQIALAHEVFRPSDEEIAHAFRVVAAAQAAARTGHGAFTVDGHMIDAPFIKQAEAIVAIARQLGLEPK